LVLKFFLNISKDTQKKRFVERLENPDKHWKFSEADLAERAYWDEYQVAFEDALSATSTKWAPWYVIPANHKWVARTVIADILATTIQSLDLEFPKVSDEKHAALAEAKNKLEQEAS
jgi:polyphosphate kinase 2 (PPK2 family)